MAWLTLGSDDSGANDDIERGRARRREIAQHARVHACRGHAHATAGQAKCEVSSLTRAGRSRRARAYRVGPFPGG